MQPVPHLEHLDLRDAGTATIALTAEGAVWADLQVHPGWRVERQHPVAGGLGRVLGRRTPRPADAAQLLLVSGEGTSAVRWEAEVARLPDGGLWEAAVNRSGYGDPTRSVQLAGGVVRCEVAGGRLALAEADPSPGWAVQVEGPDADGTELVVRFTRPSSAGSGTGVTAPPEVSELVVSLDELGEEPPLLEEERSWVVRAT